jgi:hypothetical protein
MHRAEADRIGLQIKRREEGREMLQTERYTKKK